MKLLKIFSAFLSAIMIIASCDKENQESDNKFSLVGTKWETEDFAHELLFGGNPYQVFEFTTETYVDIYTIDNGSVVDFDETTTYSLNYPHLIVNATNSEGNTNPVNYTFTNKYTFAKDGTDGNGFYAKYTRVLD